MSVVQNLLRWLMRFAAGFIIFLALLVGVARLFLPEASSLTDDIKRGVQAATGFTVDFRFISAGISFYGPELRLLDVTLNWSDGTEIVTADKLVVSLDVVESIVRRMPVPGRILVRGAEIDARVSPQGEVYIQDRPWRDLLPPGEAAELEELPDLRLQLENIRFGFRNLQLDGPQINGHVKDFEGYLNDGLIEVFADIDPGEELGKRLEIEAEVPLQLVLSPENIAKDENWKLYLSADDFRLDPWLRLANFKDLPVIGSEGSVKAQFQFRGLQAVSLSTEMDLEKVALAQPSGEPVVVDSLEGEFNWQLTSGGWLADGNNLRLDRAERVWPTTTYSIRYIAGSKPGQSRYVAESNFARLDDLLPVIRAIVPGLLGDAGIKGSIEGDLTDFSADIALLDKQLNKYAFATEFESLGYVSVEQGLDLTGYTGALTADEDGGDLSIDTSEARLGATQLFRETLDVSKLQGVAVWRADAEGYRVLANSLDLETPHGAMHASLELTAGPEFEAPAIDLNGNGNFEDVAELPRYLPKVLPVSVIEWLDTALLAGEIPRATVKLTGPLQSFPYADDSGEFHIKVSVVDGILDYAPDWPNLTEVDGQIVFDKVSLYSLRNSLTTGDINLQQLEVRMKDMRNGILTVNGAGQADFSNILAFMQVSPVGEALGPVFDDVYGEGDIEADMELVLPIQDTDNWQFDARFNARNITTGLAGVDPHFTNLTGKGSVHNTQVTMPEASATLLGDPVSIAVRPAGEGEVEFSHLADVTGTLQVPLVWDAFGQPPVGLFGGTVLLDMQALFPVMDPVMDDAEVLPFRVLVSTDLAGVTSKVPYPFNKTAEDLELMQAEAQFPEEGIIDVTGSLERGFIWTMQMHDMGEADGGWMIERGALTRDATPPPLPDEPGVLVSAYLDAADLDAWVEAFEFDDIELDAEFADWQQRFSLIDLQIGELDALLHRFPDVDLRARPLASKWDVELAGPWTEGRVIIPFDYLSDDVFEIDMQRVLLLEPLDDDGDSEIDPRTQPAIKGRIEEFSLGTMQFGALELEVERIENGLKTVVARTTAESFTTESSSDWIVVDNAQRTRFHSELRSTDFKETLRDLDYSPMVSAKRATVITDLLWEGQPGMAMVYESTGQVRLTIRDGVVDEVDAGGGRLLGLLSVTALPRRLSLDFRELTNSGLIFDKISGTFKIDFGNAWTCDLGLEGDMADMGMVGRTGMLVEDYDQVAAVRPHVSNVAPVAGAFLAGPVVGAAALLITQIFKKPLSNVGGSYFTLTGSWDEPLVTPVERSEIDTTRFSDCEQQLPEMSPEGIRALDELMNAEPKEPATPPLELQLPPIFPATEPDSESGSESAAEAPVDAG